MRNIFSRNPDFNKTAFLNWRITKGSEILNLLNLAEGFLESAITMAKACLLDNSDKKADIAIFPILTNANHGIELYLKAMIWIYNLLTNSTRGLEKGHNIQQLFQVLRAKVADHNVHVTAKGFDDEMVGLKTYIDELVAKIQGTPKKDRMDFSRYPFDKNSDDHFYVGIGNVEVDLENFIERFEEILDKLDNTSSFMYHQVLNHDW